MATVQSLKTVFHQLDHIAQLAIVMERRALRFVKKTTVQRVSKAGKPASPKRSARKAPAIKGEQLDLLTILKMEQEKLQKEIAKNGTAATGGNVGSAD